MAVLDHSAGEVRFRFAIAGLPAAGKASLLNRIHASLPAVRKHAIFVRAVGVDQVIGFDFSPPTFVPLAGHRAVATIATASGRVADPAIWVPILRDVDAILIVADSTRSRLEANIEAIRAIASHRFTSDVPIVFYHSKTDLPDALSVRELSSVINPIGAPFTTDPAAALNALLSVAYAVA